MITFGPVPSRRLGRSLGINNIPYKICTYSCVYCQIGRTVNMTIKRRTFYDPMRVLKDVKIRLEEVHRKGERVDYVTFVPDGEPTLDINIGKTAALIGDLGIPVAIITNSSLLWREDVRQDLYNFDLVSLKLDAVSRDIWRRVNRPHRELSLERILDGILEFRKNYKGKLLTETMLIDGINYEREIRKIADFVRKLSPDRAYIAVPIRPPAESWVRP
ncbi:MAG: radical SAM protein, partial [Thermoplasmata archaeon]